MYSDLYTLFLVFDNDTTSEQNGWVGKSTNLSENKVYIVRGDDTDAKKEAIKSFFSKRAAHSFCREVETCIATEHPGKNITVHVQLKVLPLETEGVFSA